MWVQMVVSLSALYLIHATPVVFVCESICIQKADKAGFSTTANFSLSSRPNYQLCGWQVGQNREGVTAELTRSERSAIKKIQQEKYQKWPFQLPVC